MKKDLKTKLEEFIKELNTEIYVLDGDSVRTKTLEEVVDWLEVLLSKNSKNTHIFYKWEMNC